MKEATPNEFAISRTAMYYHKKDHPGTLVTGIYVRHEQGYAPWHSCYNLPIAGYLTHDTLKSLPAICRGVYAIGQ